jgi:hypothetical protein
MQRKTSRPAHCTPGSATDAKELAERLRLSRERLMASELESTVRAWRLWAAGVDATVGYTRTADRTYAMTLASAANIKRQVASQLLRRFNELGVFAWEAPRHPGSRDARILELPRLAAPNTPDASAPETPTDHVSGADAERALMSHSEPSVVGPHCVRHDIAMTLERIAGEDVYRCWSCLDERYRTTA